MTLYQGWNHSFHSSRYILLRGAGALEGSADWSFAKPLETLSASLCLKVPGPPWGWWLLPSLSLPTLVHRIPAGCNHLQAAAEAVVRARAGRRDHTWVVWQAEAKELMETSRKGSYFLMVMSILDRSEDGHTQGRMSDCNEPTHPLCQQKGLKQPEWLKPGGYEWISLLSST